MVPVCFFIAFSIDCNDVAIVGRRIEMAIFIEYPRQSTAYPVFTVLVDMELLHFQIDIVHYNIIILRYIYILYYILRHATARHSITTFGDSP